MARAEAVAREVAFRGERRRSSSRNAVSLGFLTKERKGKGHGGEVGGESERSEPNDRV